MSNKLEEARKLICEEVIKNKSEDDEYENDANFNFELFQEGVKALDEKIEELKSGQGKTVEVSRGFGRNNNGGGSKNTGLPF